MGRKRKAKYSWLPKHVTVSKGYFVYRRWNGDLGKYEKQVSLGPVGMLKSELFKKYEAITNEGGTQYTVGWMLESYHESSDFEKLGNTTKKDRDYYRIWLGNHYETNYGSFLDLPLSEISTITIRQFGDSMVEKKTLANNLLRYLQVSYRWAMQRHEHIRGNPVDGVKLYTIEKTAARYIEDDEYNTFIEFAKRSNAYYLYPMLEVMYLCCLRPNEVPQLKRKDVTDTHLIARRTKGSLDTRVRLSDRLRAAIETKNAKAKVHNLEYLFYDNEGTPITYNALYGAWRRAMKKYLDDDKSRVKFRMHDLKHKGITDNQDDKAGGHKTEQMRQKYKHSIDDTEPTR